MGNVYVAVVRKQRGSDYGVEFPDLPGCITAGSTLEEALRMAREALAFHLQGMAEDGEDIPPPTPFDKLARGTRGGMPTLVPAPDVLGKVERVNITLPQGVLAILDGLAEGQGLSRSAMIAKLARAAARKR